MRCNLRLKEAEDPLFKLRPLAKEECGQIVRTRWHGVRPLIFHESFRCAVRMEPIKQWVTPQPVARL